jgi:hypothetical protein
MKGAGFLLSAVFLCAGCAQPSLAFNRSSSDLATTHPDMAEALSTSSEPDLAPSIAYDLLSVPEDLAIPPDLAQAAQCLPTGAACTFLGRGSCCSHFCVDATSLCK